jgi:squalene/oxidosqualene cyclase-like protein
MVYLPMSWLWGAKAQLPMTPLLAELRRELYPQGYENIDWSAVRGQVAPVDDLVPRTPQAKAVAAALAKADPHVPEALRTRALAEVLDHIRQEDQNTSYICIGPVNKLLHLVVWHFANPGGPEVAAHAKRLADYVWFGERGAHMQGYNSSELWDTAFSIRAMAEAGGLESQPEALERAHAFLEGQQVIQDVPDPERWWRHPSVGGWPFSTREHGWPISDCTAEGLQAALLAEPYVERPIPRERLERAVDFILSMQDKGGGWSTYEPVRAPRWLEGLNPSDSFGRIMIDHPCVECTSASLQALARFAARFPGYRARDIRRATRRGARFIRAQQRFDGGFEGSWGVCYTYGTWFAVWGLLAAGAKRQDPAIARACAFLRSHQLPDGGWGELPESCSAGHYVTTSEGQAVMTSWALLTLWAAGEGDWPAARRGLAFLEARQRPDGTYPPEHIAGVFNRTCAIHYDAYLKLFPLWAMAALRGRAAR